MSYGLNIGCGRFSPGPKCFMIINLQFPFYFPFCFPFESPILERIVKIVVIVILGVEAGWRTVADMMLRSIQVRYTII